MGNTTTTTTEVDEWLKSVNYERYSSYFRKKGYEKKESLLLLTENDLVAKFDVLEGHKRDLYLKIQKLKKGFDVEEKINNEFEKEEKIEINLLVVGDGATGKSSLIEYYKTHSRSFENSLTMKMENHQFLTIIRKRAIICQFHDCPGQMRFWNQVKEKGIIKACAIIGVCSIDNDRSCDRLDSDFLTAAREMNINCHVAIICNKMDLKNDDSCSVSYKKVLEQIERINIRKKNNFKTYYVSSFDGDNVVKAFDEIIEDTVKNYLKNRK